MMWPRFHGQFFTRPRERNLYQPHLLIFQRNSRLLHCPSILLDGLSDTPCHDAQGPADGPHGHTDFLDGDNGFYNEPKNLRCEDTTVFITEGDSAAGSMVLSRNVYTQAILTLKGNPLNCHGLQRDMVYQNEELYNMMRALGLEGLHGGMALQ